MERVDLFKPKFSGQRFEDHTLPFEILEDLSVYQDLLLQVAKDIYYKKNGNKRVPNGFGQGAPKVKVQFDFLCKSNVTCSEYPL